MTTPLISIIIPAYNTADVIIRTLKSIENQDYQHYEMVIINDGSQDETKAILDDYKKNRNNVIVHHQQNQGVSVARNKGIELSTGDFICFLDSDDTYEPDFLALMIKRQNETGAQAIYCGYNKIDSGLKKIAGNSKYYNGNMIEHFFQKTRHLPYLFHLSCMLIKKSLLIENNIYFEAGRKISEDVAFIVKIVTVSDFCSVNKNLYNYFYRENSAINASYLFSVKSDVEGWRNMTSFIEKLDTKAFNTRLALDYVKEHTLRIELSLMKHLFKSFRYKEIKKMIEDNQLKARIKTINVNHFSSTEKKIINSINSENKLSWIMLSIYYRFFKINVKAIKKGFYKKAHSTSKCNSIKSSHHLVWCEPS